jgi:hypothetical protein
MQIAPGGRLEVQPVIAAHMSSEVTDAVTDGQGALDAYLELCSAQGPGRPAVAVE